jgi:hypothetical protein
VAECYCPSKPAYEQKGRAGVNVVVLSAEGHVVTQLV